MYDLLGPPSDASLNAEQFHEGVAHSPVGTPAASVRLTYEKEIEVMLAAIHLQRKYSAAVTDLGDGIVDLVDSAFVGMFAAINRVVEPLVRHGIVPSLPPAEMVVLETRGRRSKRMHSVPLFAARCGANLRLVGTFRGQRSDWVRNLAAHPVVSCWADRRRELRRAVVLARWAPTSSNENMAVRTIAALVSPAVRFGCAFAVLAPAAAVHARSRRPLQKPARKPKASRSQRSPSRRAAGRRPSGTNG